MKPIGSGTSPPDLILGAARWLPPVHTGWNVVKRRAVLSHESSHIARGDFYILLVAAFNRCVFRFNSLS